MNPCIKTGCWVKFEDFPEMYRADAYCFNDTIIFKYTGYVAVSFRDTPDFVIKGPHLSLETANVFVVAPGDVMVVSKESLRVLSQWSPSVLERLQVSESLQ